MSLIQLQEIDVKIESLGKKEKDLFSREETLNARERVSFSRSDTLCFVLNVLLIANVLCSFLYEEIDIQVYDIII